jgi:alkylated DNA repair dioxygenase AlkB
MDMATLFPVEPLFPEGFVYIPHFISEEEEMNLYREISKVELHTFHFQGYEAKRNVASFGQDWNFETRSLSKGKDIPIAFHPLIKKVAQQVARKAEDFAELLVTHYPAGSVINWHRDAPPFDLIAGISLLADCSFRLRPYGKEKQNRASIVSFPVRRRSLYVMQ